MGIRERKQRERERRKRQILEAAQLVFPANGFRKTTMEDVAREAELSPGTLYLYFNSKEELYASLTFGFLRRFISRLKHIDTGSEAEPLQIIKGLLDAMVDVYEMDPAMLIHLVHLQSSETLYDIPVHLKSEFKELFRSSREAIAKVVHKAMSIGRVRAANPLILADILWALFSGVILREESKRFINGSTRYLRQHLDIAFEIFTRGLELQER